MGNLYTEIAAKAQYDVDGTRCTILPHEALALIGWVKVHLGTVKPLLKYNPTFEQLKADRAAGRVLVFGGGSRQTILIAAAVSRRRR